jgi:hypothetical protein
MLDLARVPARGAPAIVEQIRIVQRVAHGVQARGVEEVGDPDEHQRSAWRDWLWLIREDASVI